MSDIKYEPTRDTDDALAEVLWRVVCDDDSEDGNYLTCGMALELARTARKHIAEEP